MQHPRGTTRRDLLKLGGLGLTSAALLAACGGAPASPTAKPAAEPTKPAAAAPTTAPAAPAAKPTEAPKPAAEATVPAVIKPASGAKGITLRYHSRTGSEADTLNDRLPEFADKTGLEVKPEQFPGGEYYQKVQTLVAGGQVGDVLWMALSIGWPIWGATGILQPVDDFVSQEKFDTSQYYKAALDQLLLNGQLYALPFKLQPGQMGLYYNANAFKEAGAKEPSMDMKFDDLLTTAKALTKATGDRVERYGFLAWLTSGDNPGGWQATVHYARAFGAELMDAEGKKSQLTDPKFKEAISWVYDAVFKHKVAPSLKQITGDVDAMFVAGAGAMFQSGSWTKSVQTRVKDKFEVKNTLMPVGPSGKRGSQAIADAIGIYSKTKYPKEAWELTKFLCDKETGIRLGEGRGGASGTSGGRKDVFEDARLKANPLHPPFIEAIAIAQPPRFAANFRTQEYNQVFWQKLTALFVGDAQPTDKFFQELDQECQQVLDMPRA
ncbi:MAG: sugar ABC transporter substrate-binding protein [Chloroflexi bacterium]|nr:sugar ABC transporter substrate-binding protein [Chloroflexota bacterium]